MTRTDVTHRHAGARCDSGGACDAPARRPPPEPPSRERRCPLAMDDAPDALVVLSPVRDAGGSILDFRIECANRAWRALLESPDGPVAGRTLYDALPFAAERRELHAKVMETGVPATGILESSADRVLEYRVARSDGSLVVSLRDVTGREQTARALQASEERYRTLVEGLDAIVFVTEAGSGTTWVSSQGERMLGYSTQQLGEPGFWRSIVVPEDRARTAAVWDNDEELDEYDLEYRVQRGDGTTIWVHDRMKCTRDVKGNVLRWYGITVDITAQKELRQQLIRNERLNAIGGFASSVAHDLNDLLLGISLFTEFVRDTFAEDDPRRPDLEQVEGSAERGRALLSRLLSFARGQVAAFTPIDPARIVGDFAPIVRRLAGPAVKVHVSAERDAGRVLGDRTQVEQIVLNLASNAVHAMPNGGRLDIEVSHRPAEAPGAPTARQQRGPGGYGTTAAGCVYILVRDTGVGMNAHTAAHVFDPFFTAREAGHGNGLGLVTVQNIVKAFGGTIHVTSAPGAGTSFEVLLPRLADDEQRRSAARRAHSAPSSAGCRSSRTPRPGRPAT